MSRIRLFQNGMYRGQPARLLIRPGATQKVLLRQCSGALDCGSAVRRTRARAVYGDLGEQWRGLDFMEPFGCFAVVPVKLGIAGFLALLSLCPHFGKSLARFRDPHGEDGTAEFKPLVDGDRPNGLHLTPTAQPTRTSKTPLMPRRPTPRKPPLSSAPGSSPDGVRCGCWLSQSRIERRARRARLR
jgi:hypothetical protein